MGGLIVRVVNELRSQLILRIPCQRCESDENFFTFFRWLENAVSKNFARSHCKVRAKLDYFSKKFASYFAGCWHCEKRPVEPRLGCWTSKLSSLLVKWLEMAGNGLYGANTGIVYNARKTSRSWLVFSLGAGVLAG